MAITPLFIVDMNTLKSRLRLSGAVATDSVAILDAAVEQVRVGFYDRLGATRVAQIAAITYTANATTESGLSRTKANTAEVLWVRMLCLRQLPSMFQDGNSTTKQWNEQGAFTTISKSELDRELDRLRAEIDAILSDLSTDPDSDAGAVNVACIGPDDLPPTPGESVRNTRLFL